MTMKLAFIFLALVLGTAIIISPSSSSISYAQILEKDPPLTIGVNSGNTTSLERDVAIDIDEGDGFMPTNGTLSISTAGANDIDIQSMPPAGYTIIIDNQTARVTTHPVTIETRESLESETEQQEAESSDNGDDDNEQDNDEDDSEEEESG